MFPSKPNLIRNDNLQLGNRPNKIIFCHSGFNGTTEKLNEIMINDSFTMYSYHFYIRKNSSI